MVMKKALAVLIILVAIAACDDVRVIDLRPQADHEIVSWSQTDLGGGVWSDVSVDWKITNTGDVWCWARMTIGVEASDASSYTGTIGIIKLHEGDEATGNLAIPTNGKEATSVIIAQRAPMNP